MKTRFAPSPSGLLHVGNVRTALFNYLLAHRDGGDFLLRIEDTDAGRSRAEHEQALMEDLKWLGLDWQEGPGEDRGHGPYRQSERDAVYAEYFRDLEERGLAYPCFCTPQELSLSRKAQRASGRAPRYAGTCAHLSAEEVERRLAEGLRPTLRFRVPRDGTVEFEDLVQGPKTFATDDIGDFIIRRADGSPAFFFCNAVDDSLMGVTHVLRGEDHLTNTPRQLLLLRALDLPAPRYGHISMIVGADGAPLSKRHGSRSLRELREAGYLPEALLNYLARLGHHYVEEGYKTIGELGAEFDVARLGRAPGRYDPVQLDHWQHEAVRHAAWQRLWDWMGEAVRERVPPGREEAFVAAVRENAFTPADALHWAGVLFRDDGFRPDGEAAAVIRDAGGGFFRHALDALEEAGADYQALVARLKKTSGAKGKALFMPLRAALSGRIHGPEMARMFALMPPERIRARLEMALGKF